MRIAVMNDIHLYRKTDKLLSALKTAENPDILLLAGDLADRAQQEQYALLHSCIREQLPYVPVYSVSGNHDNPARDDSCFRAFEQHINTDPIYEVSECGAFYAKLGGDMDIIGLNPTYHQKQFFFPDRAKQLDFLANALEESDTRYHILLCHPPLIAHNPQRTPGTAPYITKEQDAKLQRIVDSGRNILFISGHTHLAPTVELDEERGNIYINNGSICPTSTGDPENPLQQGNIAVLDIGSGGVHVRITGIHTRKEFFSKFFPA